MKILDLFSGIGSFALGFKEAGYNVSRFCEIEDYCVKILNKNFPDVPVDKDIKQLHCDEGEYDVLLGGFPCQDISIAGKGKGLSGDRSGLWFEYKRLINEARPKYAVIENVSALLGRGLEIILQDLAEIGYDATWTTFDSKYFGVPQRRRRVYIVAVRDGIPSNTDMFEFGRRDLTQCREGLESFNESFRWDFEEGKGDKHTFTFYTRQRSNEFKETGLSGTLAKRDYKSFTDIVSHNNIIRRVTPRERLRLQGIPDDWFDGCSLTKAQQFTCNGMSVPVVRYIAKCIKRFDIIVNAPDKATFYSDGHYRYTDDSDTKSSIIKSDDSVTGSVFSLGWLLSRGDYVKF
ncbi:DNA methyltransferase [Vibrio phage S4-7]|nr:DNA methyltransferase [Vibrio phage S4-7]